jgi:8-oxo-dGTP diphosphatase
VHYTEYDTRIAAYAVITEQREEGVWLLLTWWNGEGRAEPAWSLPGGGVDYPETVVEGLVREVKEETGYDVEVGAPLTVDTHIGSPSPTTGRPFKSVRLVFDATIVGGELGTLEVGGSTDYAEWLPLDAVAQQPSRAPILDVAVSAHLARAGGGSPGR